MDSTTKPQKILLSQKDYDAIIELKTILIQNYSIAKKVHLSDILFDISNYQLLYADINSICKLLFYYDFIVDVDIFDNSFHILYYLRDCITVCSGQSGIILLQVINDSLKTLESISNH
jgi:hypothetical protein